MSGYRKFRELQHKTGDSRQALEREGRVAAFIAWANADDDPGAV